MRPTATDLSLRGRQGRYFVRCGNQLGYNGLTGSNRTERCVMLNLRKTLASLAANKRRMGIAACGDAWPRAGAGGAGPSGAGPQLWLQSGRFAHVLLCAGGACGQSAARCRAPRVQAEAAAYDHGAGWSTLAERYGFAVLPRSRSPPTIQRLLQLVPAAATPSAGSGEAASIRQMIDKW